jgi:hypothetical protein
LPHLIDNLFHPEDSFNERLVHLLNLQSVALLVVLGKGDLAFPLLVEELRLGGLRVVDLLDHVGPDLAISCDDGRANEGFDGIFGEAIDLLEKVGGTENSRADVDLEAEAALERAEGELVAPEDIQADLLDPGLLLVEELAAGDLIHFLVPQHALDLVIEDLKDHLSAFSCLHEIEDVERFGGFDDHIEFVVFLLVFELRLNVEGDIQILDSPNHISRGGDEPHLLLELLSDALGELVEQFLGILGNLRFGVVAKLVNNIVLAAEFDLIEVGHHSFPLRI